MAIAADRTFVLPAVLPIKKPPSEGGPCTH
nr:MAG TPA: hypothetical protein [Caudoviricetes sp.]